MLDLAGYVQRYAVGTPGANPFAGGYITLVQSGPDTLVRFDKDGFYSGRYSYSPLTVLTLQGVTATALTAANFAGLAPDGSPANVIAGTEGADTLVGTDADDTIRGLGGNDTVDGGAGNDWLFGGDGNDVIEGGAGNDRIDGGDGNDTITDSGGSDTIFGGAGDDVVTINRQGVSSGMLTIDLGAGNDRLTLPSTLGTQIMVTLGEGRDTVTLAPTSFPGAPPIITDFTAGESGDLLDLSDYIASRLVGWNGVNPFAGGFLTLTDTSSGVLVALDPDGAAGSATATTLFELTGVAASALRAPNFGGYAPDGSTAPGLVINGTPDADVLIGGTGADMIFGGDGNDSIVGGAGNDLLAGGNGNDTIEGGYGDDLIEGGAGNDVLTDTVAGSDTLRGGDGNGVITISHTHYVPAGDGLATETLTIEGGAGNDHVTYRTFQRGTGIIDLGDGNDVVVLQASPNSALTLTLGSGRDTVTFDNYAYTNGPVITDFAAGDGGDAFDLAAYVGAGTGNPFAQGTMRLVQTGADAVLQRGFNGNWFDFTVFRGATASAFTADNFGGLTPMVVGPDERATALVLAPTIVTEGIGSSFTPVLTLRNVTQINTTVTMNFVADQSTASNGVDVAVQSVSITITANQTTPSDISANLGSISYFEDALVEGAETITLRVTATGQLFANGTDTTLVTIRLADRNQTGGAGDDVLAGTRFDDALTGNDGNDRITGSRGNDIIDCGAGRDLLTYDGLSRRYDLHLDLDMVGKPDGDGTDTVTGIESIVFRDGVLSLDENDVWAQVVRIYDTAFSGCRMAAGSTITPGGSPASRPTCSAWRLTSSTAVSSRRQRGRSTTSSSCATSTRPRSTGRRMRAGWPIGSGSSTPAPLERRCWCCFRRARSIAR